MKLNRNRSNYPRYERAYEQQHDNDLYGVYGSYDANRYKPRSRLYSDDGSSTHYGKDRDDAYVRAIGHEEGYLREDDNYPAYRRYDNEKMNSRHYNDKYDEPEADNNFDYRYNNVGGGLNSRYNTFNDDRDYYRGYKEFHNDDCNTERWKAKRIKRTYWGKR